jgi:hypothetical protein
MWPSLRSARNRLVGQSAASNSAARVESTNATPSADDLPRRLPTDEQHLLAAQSGRASCADADAPSCSCRLVIGHVAARMVRGML